MGIDILKLCLKLATDVLKVSAPLQNAKRVRPAISFLLTTLTRKYSWPIRLIQVTMEQSKLFSSFAANVTGPNSSLAGDSYMYIL